MNIKELVTYLQSLPDQSARVVLSGYEGGYHDINKATIVKLRLNVNEGIWYYGPHDYAHEDQKYDELAYHLD